MKKIDMLEIDDCKLFDDIINAKNALNIHKDEVKSQYKHYQDNFASLEKVKADQNLETIKDELINCYENPTNPFKFAKNTLWDKFKEQRDDDKCPYCMIENARELDHYFSKTNYPEYSVFIPNPMPCCSICNREKGDRIIKNNQRQYINFYHDNIPDYQFLFVEFTWASDGIPESKVYLMFPKTDTSEIKNTNANAHRSIRLWIFCLSIGQLKCR